MLVSVHQSAHVPVCCSANSSKVAKMPDTGEDWVWTGDIGAACGQAWEYGATSKGKLDNGDPYFPRCTWMDTDQGADIEIGGQPITNRQMKINMMAYGGDAGDKPLSYYCGATIFTWDNKDPISVLPPEGPSCPACDSDKATRKVKRSTAPDAASRNATQHSQRPRRSQKSADRLIVNSRKQQSAVTLCNSPTSRGSDFASTNEGLFCDMSTKTLYPLCSNTTVSDCFDLQTEEMQLRKRELVNGSLAVSHSKQYKKISHWD